MIESKLRQAMRHEKTAKSAEEQPAEENNPDVGALFLATVRLLEGLDDDDIGRTIRALAEFFDVRLPVGDHHGSTT